MFRIEELSLLAFGFVLSVCLVGGVENEGDDPLQWLRNSIPGEPGTDYPIYASVQESSFSCDGLIFGGYYADPELECQVYHVCLQDPIDISQLYPVNFLCPNGTIFNQELFNCDWWYNVDCAASAGLYGLAEGAFGTQGGDGEDIGTCPAAAALSPDQCAGSVSTCWSPGQRDTDCPSNGLCCFDGCANTCDGVVPEVISAPAAQPGVIVTTTPGYNYDVPEVTLPVRPQTTRRTTPRPTTRQPVTTRRPVVTTEEPLALYGPPRQGRQNTNSFPRRNNRRNNRRQGRRVKDFGNYLFV